MAVWPARSAVTVLLCCCASCTWTDHRTTSGLKRELLERSKSGLALVEFRQQDLLILSFDGQSRTVHRSCCPSAQGLTVRGDRIAFQDLSETLHLNPLVDPYQMLELMRVGAPVVETDAKGVVVARSLTRFVPSSAVFLAADREHFAIMGPPVDHRDWGEGLYVGAFHESSARKLVGLKYARDYPIVADYPTVDWSPHSDTLLFSNQGTVMEVDVATGRSRKLVDGGAARWSPDGKYILVPEGDGGYFLGASLWVYRVSDGAWVYLDVGTFRTEWHWMETGA